MKIEYMYIDGYKNLSALEVSFEKDISMLALAGKNGSGKSNVLEAVSKIFALVMAGGDDPGFKFAIRYILHGDEVSINRHPGCLDNGIGLRANVLLRNCGSHSHCEEDDRDQNTTGILSNPHRTTSSLNFAYYPE